MNEEVKKNAMKILKKQCPDELEIYKRWERCIEMYDKGFRSVPQPMSELVKWYHPESTKEHANRIAVLGACLHFVNVAKKSGACRKWVDSIIKDIYEPQYYTFVELLYSLDTRSETERIEVARQDFFKHGKFSGNRKKLLEYYGITGEILDSWMEGSDIEKSNTGAYLIRTENELRAFAILELTEKLPDEQGAFFNVDEAAEFYDLGCQAAELAIVQDWRREHCPPAIWRMFKRFNKLLKQKAPQKKIQALLSHVPEDARPVMELLLECAEALRKDE